MIDSSPIIRRLEVEHAGRSVIPADPAMAFLDELIEDYADEWLTKAMFHYRWAYQDDIDKAAQILPLWRTTAYLTRSWPTAPRRSANVRSGGSMWSAPTR